MDLVASFAFFVFVNLLGAMSPGPDFAIVARYALTGRRSAAILAAAGIAAALCVHIGYCLFGIAVVIQNSKWLFTTVQIGGAAYLFYLGAGLLRTKRAEAGGEEAKRPQRHSPFAAGFLTNLLNPKASLFLLSLFTQFIETTTPPWAKAVYGLLVPATAFSWFSFLSAMLTHKRFLPHLQKYQLGFMRAMGAMLIALALAVVYRSLI